MHFPVSFCLLCPCCGVCCPWSSNVCLRLKYAKAVPSSSEIVYKYVCQLSSMLRFQWFKFWILRCCNTVVQLMLQRNERHRGKSTALLSFMLGRREVSLVIFLRRSPVVIFLIGVITSDVSFCSSVILFIFLLVDCQKCDSCLAQWNSMGTVPSQYWMLRAIHLVFSWLQHR